MSGNRVNPEDQENYEGYFDNEAEEYENSIDLDDERPINQEVVENERTKMPLDREQVEGITAVLTAAQSSSDPEIQTLAKIGQLRLEAQLEEARVEKELLLPDDENQRKDYEDRRQAVEIQLRRQKEQRAGAAFPVGSNEDIATRLQSAINGGRGRESESPLSLDDDEVARRGAAYNENSEERERLRRRLAARKQAEKEEKSENATSPVAPPPHRIDGRVNQRNVPPLVRGMNNTGERSGESDSASGEAERE